MTADATTRDALKPCPFCGGEAKLSIEYDPKYPWSVKSNHRDDCFLMHSNINRHRYYETDVEAIAAWNTRAQPDPREAVIAELGEALAAITEHYVDLVNSGDAGNWDPEEEEPVIRARTALAKARP
jgi:hypothetical protein